MAYGYTSGGYGGGVYDVIDKFSFASNGNASDVGNLTVARSYCAGQSSPVDLRSPAAMLIGL